MNDSSAARCIELSVHSVQSTIRRSDGQEIPFTRAMLSIRNVCDHAVALRALRVTLGQEGGTVQDVSAGLASAVPAELPPGGSAVWDVFETLLPSHAGSASKLHMFGYRAALDWLFDLSAEAECTVYPSGPPERTPVSRWTLQWSVRDSSTGGVGLTITVPDNLEKTA